MSQQLTRRAFLPLMAAPALAARRGLRVATFAADVTPPVGTPLCIGLVMPGKEVTTPLEARGVVLLPEGEQPIVLCAVDWLGIGNESHDLWRATLAKAAGTVPSRVAVQTVHQHDAPGEDRSAQKILVSKGLDNVLMSTPFADRALKAVAAAVRGAKAEKVTAVGAGQGKVADVAANRRLLGPDGKVAFGRMSSCKNSPYCEAPEGLIDPYLKTISFWNGEKRIATLAYYATHPMSYYGKGSINSDFVGLARTRQKDFTVYFTGGAGNIAPGKYNDGSPERRLVLADRVAAGIEGAKAAEVKRPVEALRWTVEPVLLPHREGAAYSAEAIEKVLNDEKAISRDRANAARYLAWLERTRAKTPIELTGLHIGEIHALHLPGELFLEYQLLAQKQRGKDFTALAAYGNYGPMYIGTAVAYEQGGYETTAVSRVGPAVEGVLSDALKRV